MTTSNDVVSNETGSAKGSRLCLIPGFLFAAMMAACGGSNDSPAPPAPVPTPTPAPPPPGPALVIGTAAVGAALSKANVAVTDSAGANVCSETEVVTTSTGTFTCTVIAGKTAPFLVVVTDPLGAYRPMVSVVTRTPAAGTSVVSNVTPLTTAIVAQLAPNGDALSLVADRSLINEAALSSTTSKVMSQIAPVLAAIGAPSDYDPFSTQLVAATASQTGNAADQVIEMLRFSTVNGVTLVATIDNPGGAVPLSNAATTNPPTLAAPTTAVLSLAQAVKLLSGALNRCFALPVASRVLAVNNGIPPSSGGPEVTSVAAECGDIVHSNYKHNGYSGGQRFYEWLNDANMVGAQFSLPEVMLFLDDATPADADRVVVNFRVVDANGVAANLIEVAQKLSGTSTTNRPTDWWLFGNQQSVDSSVTSFIRRNEQFAPNPGTAPFVNASASRFEAGINIFVNKDGPGSTGLRAARVKGPGLPPPGLVLTRLDPSVAVTNENWLVLRRKDGLTDPASATTALVDLGNIFRLQRTQGVTGTAATTVRANPNAATSDNLTFAHWAHPVDYGFPAGTANYIDFSQLRANTVYTFEYFYDGEAAPRYTYEKTMLTPVAPATSAIVLKWNPLTSATLRYLDPADPLAAEQPSITLGWSADPFSETIRSAGVYTSAAGLGVDNARVAVPRGATSVSAVGPGGVNFRALDSSGTSSRAIQLRYLMLDGSYKDSMSRFN
jgi:hypothetical protein